jgi:hypothetical protein
MKYLLFVLVVAVPFACSDDGATGPTPYGGGGNTMVQQNAGNADDASQPDVVTSQPDVVTSVPDGPETGVVDMEPDASPYLTLRVCSGNPLDTVVWPCDPMARTCTESMRISQICPLPWGCDEYSLAVVAAAEHCSESNRVTVAQGCGRTVIELRSGPGAPLRAFYSNGGLMGTWSMSDVLSDPSQCSGFVPKDCLDWEGDSLSDIVDLCATDAGASDSGSDSSDAQ